jgi:hypothetical protein
MFITFKYLTNKYAIISTDKITSIFCSIDDFCNVFELALKNWLRSDGKTNRNRKFKLPMSGVLTITVLFHFSGCLKFKHYYTDYVQKHLNKEFSATVSYNRFEFAYDNLLG